MYIRPQFALFLYPVCIHEVNVNKYPINLVESLTYMIQCTGILLMCCLQNWSLIYIINTKCGLFFKVIKKYSYVNDKFLETDFLIQRSLITWMHTGYKNKANCGRMYIFTCYQYWSFVLSMEFLRIFSCSLF
jgi:hypothetical protein